MIEVAPPAVGTDLMPQSRANPHAMVLEAYIAEVMELLTVGGPEVLVKAVLRLRQAEADGSYPAVFGMLNPA